MFSEQTKNSIENFEDVFQATQKTATTGQLSGTQ